MREERLNIISPESMQRFDAICFTSNGMVRSNGRLVMGGGVARVFRDAFHDLDLIAGQAVKLGGNHVHLLGFPSVKPALVSFPTKNDWRDDSELKLIQQSADELIKLADQHGWQEVALPRPGCDLGGLDWRDVGPAISPILDDRIVIVTYK